MPKLVSMKMTEKEQKDQYAVEAKPPEGPRYPYGLCLHLDDDVMKKLKMGDLPKVGKQVLVTALADVTSVSERESLIGGSHQSVELQITDLALGPHNDKDAGEALYGEE